MSSKSSLEDITNDAQNTEALYLAEENRRRKEAILKTDTEKFYLFTRMMRINNTLRKAKIVHKKED